MPTSPDRLSRRFPLLRLSLPRFSLPRLARQLALLLALTPALLAAQEQPPAKKAPAERPKAAAKKPPARPTPTAADYVYGTDSERQKFDFWQARSDRPTPLVLLIHGGGWQGGDKTGYGTTVIQPYLDAGISVAAINYRFIPQAMEQKVEPPVKACVLDAARALQTLRSKAQEWNLDPTRVGATGWNPEPAPLSTCWQPSSVFTPLPTLIPYTHTSWRPPIAGICAS